jgi:glycosyltransferase involved in cell wall biosynthesis
MKVLFNHILPFSLAHGGAQIQIEQTKAALEHAGVEVEFLRWWDADQRADLIHYFGRMPADHVRLAQQKGIKVVIAELLTAQGSRSDSQLCRQKIISRTVERFAPRSFTLAFNWDSYRLADACVALTPWEAHLMSYLFDAPKERVHVVPNGTEEIFLNSPPAGRGKWLVCTTTITGRKRVLELAEAAVRAQIPVWIIGRAYAEADPYAQSFFSLARRHPQTIRYEGAIADRARLAGIYREARGFVLLSTMESLSLSALEAAACGCPLFLSDLPWARSTFQNAATYCPLAKSAAVTARALREFYDAAPELPVPPKPPGWNEIARQLKTIYERVLNARQGCPADPAWRADRTP